MKPTTVATLFGGAIAGVAAMYLLDPEQGLKRRRAIASKAGTYWDDAVDGVQGQWSNLSDHAKDAGQHVYDAAHGYASDLIGHVKNHADDVASHVKNQATDAHAHAVGQAQSWIEQGRKFLSGYRDQAVSFRDQASKNAPQSAADLQSLAQNYGQAAWDRARKVGWQARDRAVDALNRGRAKVGPEQPSPVIPVAVTAISFLALGAGAMYIVDPQKGRARRAWISDKVHSFVRRTGNTAYSKGRHLANRAYGVAAEAHGAASDLVDRVNQKVGEILQDPRVVKVITDANGKVTLAGNLVQEQIDRLLTAVHATPGVSEVINKIQAITGTDTAAKTDTHSSSQQEVH